MKAAVRVYKWIIISVFLQVAVLCFINFVYLSHDETIKATSYEISDKPKKDVSMKLPEDASEAKVSFDGSYVGYMRDRKLEIVDLQTQKVKKTINESMDNLTYYRWLPDSNMVIYSISSQDNKPGNVQIYTYDVDTDVERNYPKISNLPKESRVEDIELSPQTNVIYAKIRTGPSQTQIYKFNIMNNLSYIMTATADIEIKETSFSDKLVYQDSKGRLFVRNGLQNATSQLQFKNRMALLEIDAEDKIYVGELDEQDRVVKIYYGKLSSTQSEKTWTEVSLQTPVESRNIFITRSGNIYEIVDSEKTAYKIGGSGKITYKGDVVEILDDYIVTKDGQEIKLTAIDPESEKLKK
ncbi:MAG: hypothetical protein QHH06_03775 [Clostridiales bacterium]|jgi:hypothetical protein|nr:hypothetical protein [Eubacteriales bacterium]MDH7565585.1 hypothetical protein [Clostridiales bacterium]